MILLMRFISNVLRAKTSAVMRPKSGCLHLGTEKSRLASDLVMFRGRLHTAMEKGKTFRSMENEFKLDANMQPELNGATN